MSDDSLAELRLHFGCRQWGSLNKKGPLSEVAFDTILRSELNDITNLEILSLFDTKQHDVDFASEQGWWG